MGSRRQVPWLGMLRLKKNKNLENPEKFEAKSDLIQMKMEQGSYTWLHKEMSATRGFILFCYFQPIPA